MKIDNKFLKRGSLLLFSTLVLANTVPVTAFALDVASEEQATTQTENEEATTDAEAPVEPEVPASSEEEVPTDTADSSEPIEPEIPADSSEPTEPSTSDSSSSTTDTSSSSDSNTNNTTSSTDSSTSTSTTTDSSTSSSSQSSSHNSSSSNNTGNSQSGSTNNYGGSSTNDNVSSSGNSNTTTAQELEITTSLTGEEFIDSIAKEAARVANSQKLYASVMIAQACLETGYGSSSLSQAPYYNVFGIKGSYNGKSVNLNTYEDDGSGSMYMISAGFRDYDSYTQAFLDYAKLLRGANNGFYSGVWRENALNYKQATAYLTGRYATDTAYDAKLNAIIKAYDLTKYDATSYLEEVEEDILYKATKDIKVADVAEEVDQPAETLATTNKLEEDALISKGEEIVVGKQKVYKVVEYPSAKKGYVLPLASNSYVISSPFGERTDPTGHSGSNHKGIDLAASMNTPVYAAKTGTVKQAGFNGSAGNYIIIEHEDGKYTNYFHLNEIKVKAGDDVEAGDTIGLVGSTGDSTGAHLHFAISEGIWTDYENPTNYLDF